MFLRIYPYPSKVNWCAFNKNLASWKGSLVFKTRCFFSMAFCLLLLGHVQKLKSSQNSGVSNPEIFLFKNTINLSSTIHAKPLRMGRISNVEALFSKKKCTHICIYNCILYPYILYNHSRGLLFRISSGSNCLPRTKKKSTIAIPSNGEKTGATTLPWPKVGWDWRWWFGGCRFHHWRMWNTQVYVVIED